MIGDHCTEKNPTVSFPEFEWYIARNYLTGRSYRIWSPYCQAPKYAGEGGQSSWLVLYASPGLQGEKGMGWEGSRGIGALSF